MCRELGGDKKVIFLGFWKKEEEEEEGNAVFGVYVTMCACVCVCVYRLLLNFSSKTVDINRSFFFFFGTHHITQLLGHPLTISASFVFTKHTLMHIHTHTRTHTHPCTHMHIGESPVKVLLQ